MNHAVYLLTAFVTVVLFQPAEHPDRRVDDDDALCRKSPLKSVTVYAVLTMFQPLPCGGRM
ncbi:MAG: hypothetical protein EOQ42_35205 [Mesorhizobium sp.]|nr:MAG: hypothetical protein EOQ42_35205 [Mesorhizobium sp.]